MGRVAPPGMQPVEVDGRHVVSVVSFRVRRGRVGRSPVLPFSQLNVRTYVTWKDEPAVLFLASRVTPGGLPGLLFGAPYRSARLRVKPGRLRAPGLGVDIRYRPGGPADPGELGRHELGIFESGDLKAIRIQRGPAEWQSAELAAPATRTSSWATASRRSGSRSSSTRRRRPSRPNRRRSSPRCRAAGRAARCRSSARATRPRSRTAPS